MIYCSAGIKQIQISSHAFIWGFEVSRCQGWPGGDSAYKVTPSTRTLAASAIAKLKLLELQQGFRRGGGEFTLRRYYIIHSATGQNIYSLASARIKSPVVLATIGPLDK